jgi:hypothetical protein
LRDPSRPAPQIILKPAPLCRDARAHLIAHATITPSPYQDSLRRDGGKARWELGTRHDHSACHFVSESVRPHFSGRERTRHPGCCLQAAKVTGSECRPAIFGKVPVTKLTSDTSVPLFRRGTLWAPRHSARLVIRAYIAHERCITFGPGQFVV